MTDKGSIKNMIETSRFQLQEEINRGGTSIVYRAWDTAHLQTVALKRLSLQLSQDQEAAAKIKQQARLLAEWHHPHILPILDFGQDDEGQLFFVMPLAAGGTLRDWLANGNVTLGQQLAVMLSVAQALDAAHQRNLFHGDLKPGNILFDEEGQVLLADFGWAKLSSGTPEYMSPEVAEGGAVNGRSDQYSLAIIIYEALAGSLPLAHTNPTGEPAPVNHLNKNISTALAALLEQALSRNPAERFDNLTDFVTALQAAAVNLDLILPPASSQENGTPVPSAVYKSATQPDEVLAQLNQAYEAGLTAMRQEEWPAAIDAFRQVEEIDRHFRSVVVLRRTCERSLNNAKLVPQAATEVASSVSELNSDSKAVASQRVIEGAGGTSAVSTRSLAKWKFLLPVFIVLGLGGAFFIWQQAQQASATAPPATATPHAVTAANAIQILTSDSNAIWRMNEFNALITDDGLVPFPLNGEVLSLTVGDEIVEFALSDGTRMMAGPETAVIFNSFAGWETAEENNILLEKGSLIVASTNTITVENPFGAFVRLEEGVAGVAFSDEEFRFDVDCLNGSCLLYGDLEGEVMFHTGSRAFVGGSGRPSSIEPARYDLYASLPSNADFQFPTPTPTPTPTNTPLPTSQPATNTPVNTRMPTATPKPATTATPTATATVQYIARPAPRLSVFLCSQPGQYTPGQTIPFQWTWSGTLGNGEYLELRIGPQGSTNLNSIGVVPGDANVLWTIEASRFYQPTAYDYHWEIVHMAKNQRTVLARSVRGCLHVAP